MQTMRRQLDDIGDLHLTTEERDPRSRDIAGFNAAFEELQIGSVRVGYLRKFCHTGIIDRSMLSVNETNSTPPAGVQLYAVDYCANKRRSDRGGWRV